MNLKRVCIAISGVAFALVRVDLAAAATLQDIQNGFVDGVSICQEATIKGVAVSDLPTDFQNRVSKADEGARFMVGSKNPKGPIWNVNSAVGHVLISEAQTGNCEVVTFGPPVKSTLSLAEKAIILRDPSFKPAEDTPDDYTPIRLGLRNDTVHAILEGAEPGTVPGRAFRFSMLNAQFIRQTQ